MTSLRRQTPCQPENTHGGTLSPPHGPRGGNRGPVANGRIVESSRRRVPSIAKEQGPLARARSLT